MVQLNSNSHVVPYREEFHQEVFMPKKYLNHKSQICDFSKLKTSTKKNLTELMKYTAYGLFSSIPTLKKYCYNSTTIKIYNFTHETIRLKKNELYINDKYFTGFTVDNCHCIFYRMSHHENLLCMEQKDDASPLPGPRIFFNFKLENACYSFNALQSSQEAKMNYLYSQRFMIVKDVKTFLSKNEDVNDLIKRVAKKAQLKTYPLVIQFAPRVQGSSFTIVNHIDNFPITVNIGQELCVQGSAFLQLENTHTLIITYIAKKTICIERKDITASLCSLRITLSLAS